ncbi:hypothetical protein [Agathobaculum sp. Marseille-P7918]|nr:hypothetical protein [Agathobaculum sp. Marseille-P7918]
MHQLYWFTTYLPFLIYSLIPMAIGLFLLYFVIKKAVKDAINESNLPKF